jgi:hypothetical protein
MAEVSILMWDEQVEIQDDILSVGQLKYESEGGYYRVDDIDGVLEDVEDYKQGAGDFDGCGADDDIVVTVEVSDRPAPVWWMVETRHGDSWPEQLRADTREAAIAEALSHYNSLHPDDQKRTDELYVVCCRPHPEYPDTPDESDAEQVDFALIKRV